jgi:hypothetical protein
MLGGLLTQQAEEEERQLREAAEQQQLPQRHQARNDDAASAAAVGVPASLARHENDARRSDVEGEEFSAYDDEDDIEGASEEDDEVESSYTDDDDDESSAMEHGDNEESYLLGGSEWIKQRRRRRRRQGEDDEEGKGQTSILRYFIIRNWKRSLDKLGSKIRLAVSAIADVDNVWDSPDDYSDQHTLSRHLRRGFDPRSATTNDLHANYGTSSSNNFNNTDYTDNRASTIICNIIAGGTTTRNRTAAIVWFILLSSSYAFERSTFKLLVDRVGPFRLFSAELILGSHALLTALSMAIGRLFLRNSKEKRDIDNSVLMAEMRLGGRNGLFSGLPLADVAREFHVSF